MDKTSAPKPAQYAQDVADELGWTYAGKLKSGHRRFDWTDSEGNPHTVTTGSGAHSDRDGRIDAQKVRSRMRMCMNGACDHARRGEGGGVAEVQDSPVNDIIRPGETVALNGREVTVVEKDGELAAIVDHMTGEQDVVPVSELQKAASSPTRYYHGSDPWNRESILKDGLRASESFNEGMLDFVSEDDPDFDDLIEMVRGVFVTPSPDEAADYGDDIWEVDISGYDVGYSSSRGEYVEHSIPPERLTLINRGDLSKVAMTERSGDPDFSDMSMIFLEVPETDLDVPEDAHLTLFSFEDLSDEEKETLEEIVRDTPHEKMKGTLSGHALFGGDEDILVAEIDLPEAQDLYDRYKEKLDEAGLEYKDDYDFNPHITLKRDFEGELPDSEPVEFEFDTVAVAHGDCSKDENVPLTVTAFLQ